MSNLYLSILKWVKNVNTDITHLEVIVRSLSYYSQSVLGKFVR